MSAVTPTSSHPNGRALIVGQPAFRRGPAASLLRRGYSCTEVDDPYQAMVHLCRRPLFYSAIVLSLNSLYREELPIVSSIKQRFSHVDIWLSDTDGRQAALAEAMRQGADGLFADDAMHRVSSGTQFAATSESVSEPAIEAATNPSAHAGVKSVPEQAEREKTGDPLLTAEELRALLQDSPNPTS